MPTFWVSSAGTDTANGTNLANAVKTFPAAYLLASQGDTVNMVNDGTHAGAAADQIIFSAFAGTNFATDPGLVIRGTDVSGNKALCTMAFTAGAKEWIRIHDLSNYVWVEGMRFDFTALRGTTAANMQPIDLDGVQRHVRINDCEVFLTTNFGSTVDLTTNTVFPKFPFLSGSSAASSGHLEVYNNVLINAQLLIPNYGNAEADFHNNVVMIGGIDVPSSVVPVVFSIGAPSDDKKFRQNTLIYHAWGTDRLGQPALTAGGDNTTHLVFHSNLFYLETGASATTDVGSFRFNGYTLATQTVASGTVGYNYVAIGDALATEAGDASDWDTSTATGINGYQFNSVWRGGGANAGTAVNSNDVFNRTASLTTIFNDAVASYTWTPGDYSHDMLRDLRPVLGRTAALDGGPVGALEEAINQPPVVINHTYSSTCGVLREVLAAEGLLFGATDPDGDTLTATIVSPVSHGVLLLDPADGSFDYTPNLTYTGTDTFTFRAEDASTHSNTGTVTLNVNNQTPIGSSNSFLTNEGVVLTVDATSGMLSGSSDPDIGHVVSVTSIVAPAHGTLVSYNITTGSFVYRPDGLYSGSDSFTFKLTDGNTLTAALTITIVVAPSGSTEEVTYLDTAPFFRPSLYVETEFRFRSKKNRRKHMNYVNHTDDLLWNESTHRAITVAAGATVTPSLGGVDTAQYLILETDYPIEVSIDGTDKYWPVSKCAAVALTEFSSITIHSVAATNAQVILTVAD